MNFLHCANRCKRFSPQSYSPRGRRLSVDCRYSNDRVMLWQRSLVGLSEQFTSGRRIDDFRIWALLGSLDRLYCRSELLNFGHLVAEIA